MEFNCPCVYTGMPRGVDLESIVRWCPVVFAFEERIMETVGIGGGDVIILMGQPTMPFGGNPISVGTPD